ncbi:type VII secretion protein EssA [Lacticaseibacillus zeae]|uniref:Type VII secretion protein EssA n=1 Tax=Lacticaseibacillus zeae TaxID=57037 RepID=A0A5R8M0Y8_LACZE|nr:type VII secretion protein EssA [Lacticaseibacillus zeae]TLF41859.1 type VII secretion protein EssA [Lacticaseibacillus zeae]
MKRKLLSRLAFIILCCLMSVCLQEQSVLADVNPNDGNLQLNDQVIEHTANADTARQQKQATKAAQAVPDLFSDQYNQAAKKQAKERQRMGHEIQQETFKTAPKIQQDHQKLTKQIKHQVFMKPQTVKTTGDTDEEQQQQLPIVRWLLIGFVLVIFAAGGWGAGLLVRQWTRQREKTLPTKKGA